MDLNTLIDNMDGPLTGASQNMVAAMEHALQTGESTDYLRAQKAMSDFNILVSFNSTTIKFDHDMVAGILQRM